MARNWSQVKAGTAHLVDPQRVAAAEKVMRDAVRAQRLADIRKAHGESQYVRALGGSLEVQVRIGDESIKVK